MNPKDPPDEATLIVLIKTKIGEWLPICFAKDYEDGEKRRADTMRLHAMTGARFFGVRYAAIDPDREYEPFIPRESDPVPIWERHS